MSGNTYIRLKVKVKEEYREAVSQVFNNKNWSGTEAKVLNYFSRLNKSEYLFSEETQGVYFPSEWLVPEYTPSYENGILTLRAGFQDNDNTCMKFIVDYLPHFIEDSEWIELLKDEWTVSRVYEYKDKKNAWNLYKGVKYLNFVNQKGTLV